VRAHPPWRVRLHAGLPGLQPRDVAVDARAKHDDEGGCERAPCSQELLLSPLGPCSWEQHLCVCVCARACARVRMHAYVHACVCAERALTHRHVASSASRHAPRVQGSGLSDGKYVSLGVHEVEDLEVAVAHLRATGKVRHLADLADTTQT